MDHKQFQEWLSGIDHLSPAQRQQTEAVFPGTRRRQRRWLPLKRPCVKIASARIVARQAPYRVARQGVCDGTSARDAGRHSMPRPAPPLSGLHRKDKWLSFGACLADGLTVRASAERCRLAVNTAFRWRHRFPAAKDLKARKLTGIVEADETYVLESRKGARNLERKARRRGGKASKRGLSDEQVPVRLSLIAAVRQSVRFCPRSTQIPCER